MVGPALALASLLVVEMPRVSSGTCDMTFEEAWLLVTEGKRVRRRGWRPGITISCKDGDRFVTMTIHFKELDRGDIVKHWMPYGLDFCSNDWEVAPDFPPKPTYLPKRVSRYNREPVI